MIKETYFYEISSFTPNGRLVGGFFFSLVVSLTSDLPHGSAGVCWCFSGGFAGKAPPFCRQSVQSRTKATLRSWLNRTSAVCLPHAAFLFLIGKVTLCFASSLFVVASVLVFPFLNMTSVVQL